MTPEGKEAIRQEVAGYILGTAAEWMRLVDLHVDPTTGAVTPEDDHQYRVFWEFPTDDAAFITVKDLDHAEVARFGVTITVDTLPDLPPIGPEDDPALAYEPPWHDPDCQDACCRDEPDDWINAGAVSCLLCKGAGCDDCQQVGIWREPDQPITLKPQPPKEWLPATLKDSLAGDRIRIGTEETDVLRSNVGEWHVGGSSYAPVAWEHKELWLELTANPPYQQYAKPDTAIEILCTPERAAILALQVQFPGTRPVDK